MKAALYFAIICLGLTRVEAEEVTVSYRLLGLFDPQRVEELKTQVQSGDDKIRVVGVNYDTAVVTFACNATPEQAEGAIRQRLQSATRGAFELRPLSDVPREQWQEVQIRVAALDCRGCAFAAYNLVARIDGVERAVADFHEGQVTAWILPGKTNREALVAALRKREFKVIE